MPLIPLPGYLNFFLSHSSLLVRLALSLTFCAVSCQIPLDFLLAFLPPRDETAVINYFDQIKRGTDERFIRVDVLPRWLSAMNRKGLRVVCKQIQTRGIQERFMEINDI
jgi:hypothetical protein